MNIHPAFIFIGIVFAILVVSVLASSVLTSRKWIKQSNTRYLTYSQLLQILSNPLFFNKQEVLLKYIDRLDIVTKLLLISEGFDINNVSNFREKGITKILLKLFDKYKLPYNTASVLFIDPLSIRIYLNLNYSKDNPLTDIEISSIKDKLNDRNLVRTILSNEYLKNELMLKLEPVLNDNNRVKQVGYKAALLSISIAEKKLNYKALPKQSKKQYSEDLDQEH